MRVQGVSSEGGCRGSPMRVQGGSNEGAGSLQ